jgi:hypothetical protein
MAFAELRSLIDALQGHAQAGLNDVPGIQDDNDKKLPTGWLQYVSQKRDTEVI